MIEISGFHLKLTFTQEIVEWLNFTLPVVTWISAPSLVYVRKHDPFASETWENITCKKMKLDFSHPPDIFFLRHYPLLVDPDSTMMRESGAGLGKKLALAVCNHLKDVKFPSGDTFYMNSVHGSLDLIPQKDSHIETLSPLRTVGTCWSFTGAVS